MTEPPDSAVRLACPRCFAPLSALSTQVGMKRRCPRCHWVFQVPSAAELARRHREPGEYRISADEQPPLVAGQRHQTVICPVCHALMYGTEDQVGQQMACPDCGTPVVVPPPVQAQHKIAPPASGIEEYALCDDLDAAARGARAADLTYVPFTCPVCGTFMQLPEDQVGKQVTCPDCRVSSVVSRPIRPRRQKHAPAAELGEYALREEDDQRSGGPAARQDTFPLRCPLCDSLMYAAHDQIGQQTRCDDCQTTFVVPRPPPPGRRPDLSAQAGDVYSVGDSADMLDRRPAMLPARSGLAADVRPATQPPPRWTFFSGVFTFPVLRNSQSCWLALSLGLTLPLGLGWFAVSLAMGPAGPWSGAAPWLASMMFSGAAALLGILWIIVAFSYCLSILRDTSYGYHQVENWPDAVFLDWVGEVFFLLSSLTLSALPGVVIAGALNSVDVPRWPIMAASLTLLLPINLLATLETNSPLDPISLPVWRTLLSGWWAWGLFYVESTLVIAAGGLLAVLAAVYVPFAGIVLGAFPLVTALMIYFRLLGRLVWRCTIGPGQRAARKASSPETED